MIASGDSRGGSWVEMALTTHHYVNYCLLVLSVYIKALHTIEDLSMAFFGTITIHDQELISCEFADEYNIITGFRSSQFLGRKARAAKLRLNFNGANSRQRVKLWRDAADLGTARGFGFGQPGTDLEGIFGKNRCSIQQGIKRNYHSDGNRC
jgi:hypothetical protein